MVSKADGTNGLRLKATALADKGGPPTISRPKRKRGYHRALKRGEQWALLQKITTDLMNNVCRMMYENQIKGALKMTGFYNMLNGIKK